MRSRAFHKSVARYFEIAVDMCDAYTEQFTCKHTHTHDRQTHIKRKYIHTRTRTHAHTHKHRNISVSAHVSCTRGLSHRGIHRYKLSQRHTPICSHARAQTHARAHIAQHEDKTEDRYIWQDSWLLVPPLPSRVEVLSFGDTHSHCSNSFQLTCRECELSMEGAWPMSVWPTMGVSSGAARLVVASFWSVRLKMRGGFAWWMSMKEHSVDLFTIAKQTLNTAIKFNLKLFTCYSWYSICGLQAQKIVCWKIELVFLKNIQTRFLKHLYCQLWRNGLFYNINKQSFYDARKERSELFWRIPTVLHEECRTVLKNANCLAWRMQTRFWRMPTVLTNAELIPKECRIVLKHGKKSKHRCKIRTIWPIATSKKRLLEERVSI